MTQFCRLMIIILCALSVDVLAEDLNCMLCHKYFGLSGFTATGKLKIHYVNDMLYQRSPHSEVECIDCHVGVDEVPHEKVDPVDCAVKCHVDDPSTGKAYSHKSVGELLKKSIHSTRKKNGQRKKYKKDMPQCRDCHDQPLYRTLDTMNDSHEGLNKKAVARCNGCHEKNKFSEKYLRHIVSRIQRQTDPIKRIEICAKCHGDRGMLERHDMDDTVSSYKETFHYKMLRLGAENTPDCIDCHDKTAVNGHLILGMDDPRSPTHEDNVGETCQQSDCHQGATKRLAGFQTHVTYEVEKYPLQFYLLMFFRAVMSVVLFGFLGLVFLELFRRLMPRGKPE